MAKIKKVANGEYIGANKYTIKDAGGGKSTVDFAPDSVLTPGTEVGAELLNEMQLNALYTLDTNRVVEGQKEVYVANLEGFTDFTKPDLSFYLKINSNNTNAQTYLRIDTTDYLIKCKINDLTKNSIVACRKVGSEIIVLNNYMQRQDNAIWGGLDGGGLIEDPSVTKVVGKRYIGADGKAYICRVPSNVNNSTNYTPCNVVDNLDKLQNLHIVEKVDIKNQITNLHGPVSYGYYHKIGNIVTLNIDIIPDSLTNVPTGTVIFTFPQNIRPISLIRFNQDVYGHKFYINTSGQLIYMTKNTDTLTNLQACYINETFMIQAQHS